MTPTPSAPSELRRTLDDSLLVRHISTRMETCRGDQRAAEIRAYMEERNYDVMGLFDGERLSRYIARNLLTDHGTCLDHGRHIEPTEIVSSTTPLIDLLPIMKEREHLFVLDGARLEGIVTSADLQKPPVRMLLFGLVSLLDMFLLVLVRRNYSEELIRSTLKPKRLDAAQKLYDERRARNEEIDLADCIQICDKRDLALVVITPQKLGFDSRGQADKLFKDAEGLRNRLAHSQDLVLNTSWAKVIDLAEHIDRFLQQNEGMIETSTPVGPAESA
jgi:CBS domain-containing protein